MDMKDKHMTNVDNKCISCKGDAVEFVDTLAKKEYDLSGLCQTCQDGVFHAVRASEMPEGWE